ncbi:MAG TPA: aquaporin [Solirubrobacterales bacterium]|nr:aquaporin [Solirubrobacterales bacterium]
MQQRGLAAYLAELIGTFLLVFFIASVVVLFVATGNQAQFGSDYAVVGLVQGLALFGVIVMFGAVSGGHFNPAVTLAAAVIKRISPVDALIYMLAQLSGGVLGALLVKGLLVDEGRASHYGAPEVTGLLGGNFQGAIIEAIGVFCLVLVILAAVYSKKSLKDWAPLAIGTTFVFIVMVGGPLSGGSFNPARWFGTALVGNEWGGVWPYVVGPIVGSLLAAGVFQFILEPGGKSPTEPPERVKAPGAPKPGSAA